MPSDVLMVNFMGYDLTIDRSYQMFEPIFEWESVDKVEKYYFRTGTIDLFLKVNCGFAKRILITTHIEPDFALHIKYNCGIEEHHLMSVTPSRIDEPVIGCHMHNDKVTLVDGNHRYLYRYMQGLKTVEYYVLPRELWRYFLLNEDEIKGFIKARDHFSGRTRPTPADMIKQTTMPILPHNI
jgi:hypothetical protein